MRAYQIVLLIGVVTLLVNHTHGESCSKHGAWSCSSDGKSTQVCQGTTWVQIPCPSGQVCQQKNGHIACVVGNSSGGNNNNNNNNNNDGNQGGGNKGGNNNGGNTNGGGNASGGKESGKEFADSYEQFKQAVASCGYQQAPTKEQYENAVSQARKDGGITTRREFAMFLAEIMWESGGLKYKKELNPPAGHYVTPNDVPGQQYYGRGYIQLSWHYNYLAASKALYGDDRLAKNADMVANDDKIAWATTFWYWKANVHSAPGVQDGKFGSATNAINGALECRGAYQEKARKRFQCVQKVAAALNVKEPITEGGCYN